MNNRDLIIQSIIYHDVIGKRVPSLQQLRNGLKMLGVLELIINNPDIFEPLFVYREGHLNATSLKEKLEFDERNKMDNEDTHKFLMRYLEEATVDSLEDFLILCHGSKLLPITEITVSYGSTPGFAISTCLQQLSIPVFKKYEDFVAGMNIMVASGSFSTV